MLASFLSAAHDLLPRRIHHLYPDHIHGSGLHVRYAGDDPCQHAANGLSTGSADVHVFVVVPDPVKRGYFGVSAGQHIGPAISSPAPIHSGTDTGRASRTDGRTTDTRRCRST